jgi:MFS family permease
LNGLDWPWLFLINLPVGLVAFVLAIRFLPSDVRAVTPKPRLDLVGALLLVPALAGLLYGLTNVHLSGGFGRTDVLVPAVGGALLLAGFVVWGVSRDAKALVDVRLLGKRSVSSASLVLVLLGAPMFAGMFLLPLYWQGLRGYDVLGAALILIPQGVGSLLARSFAGSVTDRLGSRWVAVFGCLVVAASTAPFALTNPSPNLWVLEVALFVRGLGLGTVFIPVMVASMVDLAKESIAHASMLTRIVQQLGGSFATAALAVILQAGLAKGDPLSAFGSAFWVLTACTALAGLASLWLPQKGKSATSSH